FLVILLVIRSKARDTAVFSGIVMNADKSIRSSLMASGYAFSEIHICIGLPCHDDFSACCIQMMGQDFSCFQRQFFFFCFADADCTAVIAAMPRVEHDGNAVQCAFLTVRCVL